MGTNTTRPDSEETALVDFVYLSVLAYNDPNVTQKLLDNWFGKGTAIDQENITAKFKEEYNDFTSSLRDLKNGVYLDNRFSREKYGYRITNLLTNLNRDLRYKLMFPVVPLKF